MLRTVLTILETTMIKATKYVLGFAFDNYDAVAMILKQRPKFQLGKWNGIGGHVESTDKSLQDAMSREFKEECGQDIPAFRWRLVGTMCDETNFIIYVLTTRVPVLSAHTTSDETVKIFTPGEQAALGGDQYPCLANIPSLLALTQMGPGHDGVIPYFRLTYGTVA